MSKKTFICLPHIDIHFRTKPIEKIDKEKLLAIARKNALKLIDAGIVPGTDKLTTIKAGGKTVNELTGKFAYILIQNFHSKKLSNEQIIKSVVFV